MISEKALDDKPTKGDKKNGAGKNGINIDDGAHQRKKKMLNRVHELIDSDTPRATGTVRQFILNEME